MTKDILKQKLDELVEQHADQVENTWLALAGELPADMADTGHWFANVIRKRGEIDALLMEAHRHFRREAPAAIASPTTPPPTHEHT